MKLKDILYELNSRIIQKFNIIDHDTRSIKIPSKLDKILKYLSHRGYYERIKKRISSINYASKNWNEFDEFKIQEIIDEIITLLLKIKNYDSKFTAETINSEILINIDVDKLKYILR